MTGRTVTRRTAATPVPASFGAPIDLSEALPEDAGALVNLLAEQSPLYAGRTSIDTERLRGRVLASFETAGLPPQAIPFVLEELETGRNPSTVAAAGRAVRAATTIPAEAPELLVAAIARLRGTDDVVSFQPFGPATAGSGTAVAELAQTLALLGPRAKSAIPALKVLVEHEGGGFSTAVRAELARALDALSSPEAATGGCCCAEDAADPREGPVEPLAPARSATGIADLTLENQDGARLTFGEAFGGWPSALAFFYTRCMNPEKCSRTVTLLARLARRVEESGLDANVAGMSYDPRYDRPGRLRNYGADRGMVFSPRCSLLRTRGRFDPIAQAFGLGVGFGPVTVNRHRLDVVVLDGTLGVVQTFERRLWSEEAVLEALIAAGRPAG